MKLNTVGVACLPFVSLLLVLFNAVILLSLFFQVFKKSYCEFIHIRRNFLAAPTTMNRYQSSAVCLLIICGCVRCRMKSVTLLLSTILICVWVAGSLIVEYCRLFCFKVLRTSRPIDNNQRQRFQQKTKVYQKLQ